MSRIRVFDTINRSAGEFHAACSRGWSITGNTSVRGGGETSVKFPMEIAEKPYMQFGRMVMVEEENLPPWAGMIDPDWSGVAPYETVLYNMEYLFSLRKPDQPMLITGTTASIVTKIIELINAQEELYLRAGVMEQDVTREETLDRRTFWEQAKALIQRAGMEMTLRPAIVQGQLFIYVDVKRQMGGVTNFEYKDGAGGNMTVTSAKINQTIVNRVVAINDASTEESRLQTAAFVNDESRMKYRLRSDVVQFRGVTELSTLEAHAKSYLNSKCFPYLEMTVRIKNIGSAFQNARLGNTVIFHASNILLPGGRSGWRGEARIMAMAYDEPSQVLGVSVVGRL